MKKILEEILKGEGKKVEFKTKITSGEKIAQTVVAFSNTGGGKIFVGVNNKGEVVGIKDTEIFALQDKIASIIHDLCYPFILPEIYNLNIDNKIIIVIEVFRGSLMPYYIKTKGKFKGTYIRVGATNRLADEKIITELERQKNGIGFDEEINFNIPIDDNELKVIYNEFKKNKRKCNYQKLINLKLIKKYQNKEFPTNALLITLGKLDNTSIKCARFKGTEKEFLDKKEFNDNLFENLKNTINFLKNHLNLNAKIEELKRVEEYEIPIVALREAILNAIIHRDYTTNSSVKVAIYDDIVEISSPGTLPNGITVEDVFLGRSELRNKVLANLFKELKYIEAWGTGIERIDNLCKERGIKFIFEEKSSFVRCIFERKQNQKTDEYRRIPTNTDEYRRITAKTDELSDKEKLVIEYIKRNEKITTGEVEKLTGLKSTQSKALLHNLQNKGFIKKIGKTKGSYYILIKNRKERIL